MSASSRAAPAREVRRKYPRAVAIQDADGRWLIVASISDPIVIGTGKFRPAAWSNAKFRLNRNG
jgi:hypothetical protein